MKPSLNIQIDVTSYESGQSRLISCEVEASLYVPSNVCRFSMSHPEGIDHAPGASVVVKMGEKGNEKQVFTGVLTRAARSFTELAFEASSDFRKLSRLRLSRIYEDSSMGDIVKDLANEASVALGSIDNGLKFPSYVVSPRMTVYAHLSTLSEQGGFQLYADPEDKLMFHVPTPSGAPGLFQYGVNVLSVEQIEVGEGITEVEVFGESPASLGQGNEATSWLTKKNLSGKSGSGDTQLRVYAPAVRTQQDAAQISQQILDRRKSRIVLKVKVLGAEGVHLTDVLQLQQMPQNQHNGTFSVTALKHRFTPDKGFFSHLTLEKLS
ncbi:MAG: hypothetical protein AAGI38_12950 [Bacteroidota bacterium]